MGEHIVRVCHGTACHVSGARQITEELRRQLGFRKAPTPTRERMFTVDEVACLGCCSLAPVLMVDDHTAGNLTPATACEALDDRRAEGARMSAGRRRNPDRPRLLRRRQRRRGGARGAAA